MSDGPDLTLRGGLVLTPEGMADADVRIRDGVVVEVGPDLDVSGDVLDCSGCWVGPGLVDPHSHLREPGQEWKEDVASGSRAAAVGGYTAVVAMPNTDPPIDGGHLARFVTEQGRRSGLVRVASAGCLSAARAGEHLAHLDDLWRAGVRIFTDDGDAVADAGLLRRAMDYLAELGGVVAQHAEDAGLSRGGHVHEGTVSAELGMVGIPAEAEETVVARDMALVRLTGAAYHVQHVSTAGTVALIREAKAAGLPVTAEVTPHHLFFDHGAVLSTDAAYKMYPPLRREEDVAALREALGDGTIDMIGTDHAPHASHEKDVPFEEAPRGVIGLETAVGAVLTATGLDPEALFARMSVAPARLAGLEDQGRAIEAGSPASLVAIDPQASHVVESFVSKSANSPFLGETLKGVVRHTVFEGRVTVRDGKVAG